jgi:CDP-glycerol glycerophosphotransferase
MDIVHLVKNNKFVFKAYYYGMSLVLRIVRLFIRTDDKLILFVSYGGRHFNDSPKCIYEAMKLDLRFKNFKLVWAFINPNENSLDTPKIRIDSFKYYLTALKARCWVTNVAIERGLNFKGKNTFYLHTTHTTLPKLMGYDDVSDSFTLPCGFKYDCSCAQSEIEKKMQESMFRIDPQKIIVSGYPKNDILCNYSRFKREEIRNKLGFDNERKLILYAPTYRDISFGAMRCPVDFKKWEKVLGKEYAVLFRAHPVVANETKIDSSTGFVFDVSHYPDNMELMIASDMLISDYSGIFFEYGVQDKPMFCFAYDYEQYVKVRGLYFDIRELIPGGKMNEDSLLSLITNSTFDTVKEQITKFRKMYVSEYGHATEICHNTIYNNIFND